MNEKKEYQVNIIDKDLDSLRKFEKEVESKYSDEILTGFSIMEMKDGNFLWQAFFTNKEHCNKLYKLAKLRFGKVNQDDINPLDYMDMVHSIWTGGLANYRA